MIIWKHGHVHTSFSLYIYEAIQSFHRDGIIFDFDSVNINRLVLKSSSVIDGRLFVVVEVPLFYSAMSICQAGVNSGYANALDWRYCVLCPLVASSCSMYLWVRYVHIHTYICLYVHACKTFSENYGTRSLTASNSIAARTLCYKIRTFIREWNVRNLSLVGRIRMVIAMMCFMGRSK